MNNQKLILLGIIAEYQSKIEAMQIELNTVLKDNAIIGDAYIEIAIHNADNKLIGSITKNTLDSGTRKWYCYKSPSRNITIHSITI